MQENIPEMNAAMICKFCVKTFTFLMHIYKFYGEKGIIVYSAMELKGIY